MELGSVIINISQEAAKSPRPQDAPHAATKAAVMKMTPQPGPDAHNSEVTGSNPVPATTKALARDPFGEATKES